MFTNLTLAIISVWLVVESATVENHGQGGLDALADRATMGGAGALLLVFCAVAALRAKHEVLPVRRRASQIGLAVVILSTVAQAVVLALRW
jgi:hypothetical protein